jgi:hypothetical protein
LQDAFPRRAVPSDRREGRSQTEVALHLRIPLLLAQQCLSRTCPPTPRSLSNSGTGGNALRLQRKSLRYSLGKDLSTGNRPRTLIARFSGSSARQWRRAPRCSLSTESTIVTDNRAVVFSQSSDALVRFFVSFESSAVVIGPKHESHALASLDRCDGIVKRLRLLPRSEKDTKIQVTDLLMWERDREREGEQINFCMYPETRETLFFRSAAPG